MATFIFSMNVSLDGYVDHEAFAPDPVLFRHWIEQVRGAAHAVYGRRIYGIMRYWEEDRPGWDRDERDFARAWRDQHKWVVSETLTAVGPNATLVSRDIAATLRRLKAELTGTVDVSGTVMARTLGDLGLIDAYRLYYHPVVLGGGTPFFAGPRPALRIAAHDRIGERAVRLTCVPA